MKAIGVDLGTTTISVVVCDVETKKVVQAKTIANGSFIETENDWERIQDAGQIVTKAKAVLDEMLSQYGDVCSIGLTGQMHGILYVDANGQGINPLYIWQDGRGSLPEFDGRSLTEVIGEECDAPAATGYGLVTHLYQLKKGLVPKNAAKICTVPDYLGMVLTGRKTPLMHISMAASLGLYDSKSNTFMVEEIEKIGNTKADILPEVTDEFSVLGTYQGIPVTAAIGDNQASFIGSAGLTDNVILVNMGTGGQISVLSDQYFTAPGIEARPIVKGKYLLAGSSLCGGRSYAILEKFFRGFMEAAGGESGPQYEAMALLARKGKLKKDRLKVQTTFNGTRVDPQLRGSITNISENNFTPEDLVYGVLDGMADELYEEFVLIHEGTGILAEKIIASGNGLRKNEVLREIFSEKFQASLQLAECEEEAACGAAITGISAIS